MSNCYVVAGLVVCVLPFDVCSFLCLCVCVTVLFL